MSHIESYIFVIFRSINNSHILTHYGGVNEYICKYMVKIDENNYVVVFVK